MPFHKLPISGLDKTLNFNILGFISELEKPSFHANTILRYGDDARSHWYSFCEYIFFVFFYPKIEINAN